MEREFKTELRDGKIHFIESDTGKVVQAIEVGSKVKGAHSSGCLMLLSGTKRTYGGTYVDGYLAAQYPDLIKLVQEFLTKLTTEYVSAYSQYIQDSSGNSQVVGTLSQQLKQTVDHFLAESESDDEQLHIDAISKSHELQTIASVVEALKRAYSSASSELQSYNTHVLDDSGDSVIVLQTPSNGQVDLISGETLLILGGYRCKQENGHGILPVTNAEILGLHTNGKFSVCDLPTFGDDNMHKFSYFNGPDVCCIDKSLYGMFSRRSKKITFNRVNLSSGEMKCVFEHPEAHYGASMCPLVSEQDSGFMVTGGKIDRNGQLDSVYLFKVDGKPMSLIAQMPRQRSWHSSCIVDNKLVCTGGIDCPKTVESYDLETQRWSQEPNMLNDHSFHASVLIEQRLFVIGGLGQQMVEMWDPRVNYWVCTSQLKQKRDKLAVAVYKDSIYAIGGVGDNGHSLNSTEIYEDRVQAWRQGPKLIGNRFQCSAITVKYKLPVPERSRLIEGYFL